MCEISNDKKGFIYFKMINVFFFCFVVDTNDIINCFKFG